MGNLTILLQELKSAYRDSLGDDNCRQVYRQAAQELYDAIKSLLAEGWKIKLIYPDGAVIIIGTIGYLFLVSRVRYDRRHNAEEATQWCDLVLAESIQEIV